MRPAKKAMLQMPARCGMLKRSPERASHIMGNVIGDMWMISTRP
jgi:hypothetical protein